MNRRMFFTLIFISFCSYAQNPASLYSDFIPLPISQNQNDLKMYDGLISQKAAIHPELIYFLLKRTEAGYDTTLSATERKLFLAKIRDIENDYLKRRNDWVQNELELMQNHLEKTADEDLQDHTRSYLNDMVSFKKDPFKGLGAWGPSRTDAAQNTADTIDTKILENYPIQLDHNFMDFIVLKYYTLNDTLAYNANKSYKADRTRAEINIRKSYAALYRSLENAESCSDKEVVEKFLQSWYLFDQDAISQNDTGSANSFFAYEFVIRYLRCYYFRNNINRFSVSLIYARDSYPTIDANIPIEGYGADAIIRLNQATSQLGLALTYRILFDNYVHLLSYLSIQASFVNRSASSDKMYFDPGFSSNGFQPTDYGTRISESLVFNTGEIANYAMQSYEVKLTVPVFTFGTAFVFESGLITKFNRLEFDMVYDYEYLRIDQGPLIGGGWVTTSRISTKSGLVEEDKTLNRTSLFPVFDFNFNFHRTIGVSATLVPKYLSFRLNLNF